MEVLIESLGIIGGVEGIGSAIGNLYRTPKLFEGMGQGEVIAAGELPMITAGSLRPHVSCLLLKCPKHG
jgi:hypothetical protein